MQIITNNHRRELVSLNQLPEDAQSDFEYLKMDEWYDERFVQYKGEWYDVNDTMNVGGITQEVGEFKGWHSYISDTFFSGILFKWPDPAEADVVIVGRYFA